MRSVLSRVACECQPSEESKWEMENVHGLHGPKQNLPEGQFPSAKNRPASRFYNRA